MSSRPRCLERIVARSVIRTIEETVVAFRDEDHCRRLLEGMVWPNGRICPACGYKRSIAIAGRDMGKRRARPGLYQCSNGDCRFQFTVTTHTPLHSTKLPCVLVVADLSSRASERVMKEQIEAVEVHQPRLLRAGFAVASEFHQMVLVFSTAELRAADDAHRVARLEAVLH